MVTMVRYIQLVEYRKHESFVQNLISKIPPHGGAMRRIFIFVLITIILATTTIVVANPSPPQKVRIAAFNLYPALFQAKDGSVQGFYVDFLNEIARREGWTIEYVYGSWAEGLSRIKTGEVDLLTNVAFTAERAQFMDYGKVPLLTVWAELYAPNGSHIDSIRNVEGKKIALMKGDFNAANFKNLVEKFGIPCTYVEYGNFEEVFKAISARQVDGGIVNNTFGTAKQSEYDLKSTGVIFNPFDIFFTVQKGKDSAILAKLDQYLEEWRKSEGSPYHQARKRWSHGSASTIMVVNPWLKKIAVIFGVLLCVAIGFVVLLRIQVRRKTAEIRKYSDELQLSALELEEELAERQVAQEALQDQATILEEEIEEHRRSEEALKRSEDERSLLEAQLHQAQKLESVGRLAGGVAHDFNNMLGVIIGHASLGLIKTDPTHPLHNHLVEINNAAERSADLTRQLLAFARKQAIEPKVLDLNDTISGMLKMLQRLIGEDIHLCWQPGSKLWQVKMDPSQIDQILANLCVNARDAIDTAGKIFIETGNISIDKAYSINHTEALEADYVWLSVSDDGSGMDKETLTHIFEPFFTTKDPGKGTGLGLATVYGIVKQNDGFVNVYSEPGSGTTFTIYIPRHIGKFVQEPTEGVLIQPPCGNETILLVEDEPAILEMTSLMLRGLGYTVLSASTPSEAVRMVREHDDAIHLLLTDVVMPEMNGRNLVTNLTTIYPGLKCLFMSGYTADVIAHHGVIDQGLHFIQKPFPLQTLASKVREVLEGA